jgi:GNAT superfamily N-acetyltransferase
VRIREAKEADLERLGEIFVAAWENLHALYAPRRPGPGDPRERIPFLQHLRRTGLVLVADDPEPVGFAAAVLRDGAWFLSQLWVLPDHHGAGVGSTLLDAALRYGRGASSFATMASPHPAAQLLYLRASMFPLWVSIEMTGEEDAPRERRDDVRDLVDGDQEWIDDIDRDVRGGARSEDHAFWRSGDGIALALVRPAAPAGYVYVWPDGKVGPGAVRHASDLPALIGAARNAGAATFPVPSTNRRALIELVRLGLRPTGATTTFMASRALADGTRYLPTGALG